MIIHIQIFCLFLTQHQMALANNEARILDSLRPIFPQLNDTVILNCVRNVRETVGSDPLSIIPGCIDVLLAEQSFPEFPVPQNRPAAVTISPHNNDPARNFRIQNNDDDVIFVASTSRSPKTKAPSHHVISLIDENEVTIISNTKSPASSNNTLASPQSLNTSRPTETRTISVTESTFSSTTATTGSKGERDVQSKVCHVEKALDPAEEALKNLRSLFPDVEDAYVQTLLKQWSHIPLYEAVNNACNELLEKKDYPRKSPSPISVTNPVDDQKDKDYFQDFSTRVSDKFRHQCFILLQNDFRMIPVKYIRLAMSKFKGHYAPSKRYLQEQLRISNTSNETSTSATTSAVQGTTSSSLKTEQTSSTSSRNFFVPPKIVLLRCGRPLVSGFSRSVSDKELQREIDFMRKYELSRSEEMDRMLAASLNDEQYEEEGQKIECGCCYSDAAFEDMVQCLEGHLFCASCLMNYAKEAAFGQGKATLTCLTDGCDGTFPLSQLKKALPTNILEKYEDRVKEESLLLAQMDDFVRCPSCDFAAILPPEVKVFKCQNPSCAKETCRYCKEDWSEHFGLRCNEVEKSAQKDVRLSYEEKMTMAKIRKCPKCGCEFTKSDGCNKMTCRCGMKMCYVCRKPNIGYNHFCQHPRDPGKPCAKCKSCSLWSDPSEDDDRAVKEIEKEALEAKRKFEAENVPSEDNPAKKSKTN